MNRRVAVYPWFTLPRVAASREGAGLMIPTLYNDAYVFDSGYREPVNLSG